MVPQALLQAQLACAKRQQAKQSLRTSLQEKEQANLEIRQEKFFGSI